MTGPLNSYSRSGDRYYNWKGQSYVSVTTILDRLPKPQLQAWKDKKLIEDYRKHEDDVKGKKPEDVIKHITAASDSSSMGNGSLVHSYLEGIAKGYELPMPENEEMAGFYQQCHRFMDDYRPVFIESEATIYSDRGYAGTLDQIIEISGKRYICDTKTGKSIWPEVALQLSAYRNGTFIGRPDGTEEPVPECPGRTGLVLHIRPDRYMLRTVNIGSQVWQTFLSLMDVFNWSQELNGYVLGDALPIYE